MEMIKIKMSAIGAAIKGKHKKAIGIILALAAVFIAGLVGLGMWQSQKTLAPLPAAEQPADSQADIIYYYGQECTNCDNVEKFIADNKIDDKISFAKKEVWHNAANSQEMQEKASECTLEPSKIGVPFLWARGKCYVGEVEVQDFLKKEIGMQ